jgi:molybdopterin-guanine dinucleotide biosynthesis protein MobB
MNIIKNKKIIGFAAFSGTGKTTLIKSIVTVLKKLNYTVSVIKHAHHNFDLDKPEKDSYEIRKAGAENMLISSRKRWALIHENINNNELNLSALVNILDNKNSDIILVEGFKAEKFPKIELYRKHISKSFLHENDENIVAIACDEDIKINRNIKKLDINNPQEIAKYIIGYLQIDKKS